MATATKPKKTVKKVIGRQTPTFRYVPAYRYSKGDDAATLADLAGLSLFEWQKRVLKDWLSYKAAGDWACRQSLLLAPRQQGKSRLLVAYALYLLVVERVPLVMYSAHEFRTAQEVFRREMRHAVQTLYDAGALKHKPIFRDNTTETSVELGACKVLFTSRSSGTGRGFSGDILIMDECYALTPEQDAALRYTISARPDAVIRYASSAGMMTSEVLEALRERGYAKKMPIHDWAASPDDDFSLERTWAKANPSYGFLLTKETVQSEYDAPSAGESFPRERLGVWELRQTAVEIPQVFESATIANAWSISEIVGPLVFAVAAEADRSRAFIAVAGETESGVVKVELLDTEKKVSWVTKRLTELDLKWSPLQIVYDAVGGLNSIADVLSDSDLPVHSVGTADAIKAKSSFEDALNENRMSLHYDEMLADSLKNANERQLRTGSLWDTPRNDALESPLNAVTLAYHGWLTRNRVKTTKKKRTGRWLSF